MEKHQHPVGNPAVTKQNSQSKHRGDVFIGCTSLDSSRILPNFRAKSSKKSLKRSIDSRVDCRLHTAVEPSNLLETLWYLQSAQRRRRPRRAGVAK